MEKFKEIVFACLCLYYSSAIAQLTPKELSEAGTFSFTIYKQIHQKPELGKKEFETSALIISNLKRFGYSEFYSVPGLPTAVVAVLNTKRSGPVIALRAELDARPGKEATGLPYSSIVSNVMHSCGHDAHTAILLSTAELLFKHAASLSGKIVFIFQPAEEIAGGADDIVKSDILKTLKVERLFALHCYEVYPVGTINICPGYVMAGSNYFTIDITGKGSHAGFPFRGDDIPVALSELVQGLSEFPARKINISERPCIISTTYIQTGDSTASNILPEAARFKGTVRAYEDIDSLFHGQPSIRNLIETYIEQFCKPRNLTYKIDLRKGSPPTRNDEQLYDYILPKLRSSFSGTIDITPYKSMAAEDFSYYTNQVPCLYFSLGIAKDSLGKYGVHTSKFSVHQDSFQYGIELMAFLAGLQVNKSH